MPITLNLKTAPAETQVFVRPPEQVYNLGGSRTRTKVENHRMSQDFLKAIPLFAGLSETQLSALRQNLIRRHFRQGEAIFQQGDPGQMLYIIESGQVRIYLQDEEGQETSVIVYGPGEIFGELAVIDGLPRSASAVAMEDTVVHTLNRDSFREHMRSSPQLGLNFMKTLSVRVRYSTQQVSSLTLLDVPGRLARKLLELAQQHGAVEPEGVRINLTLTQSDLAGLIGTTRESINKTLGVFRRQRFILMEQGHIIIIDPDALRELGS
jgi:CRP/FNR family transcriptional regulator/CRP/FNR family cyclic AMP-dependent transcriptional regulator